MLKLSSFSGFLFVPFAFYALFGILPSANAQAPAKQPVQKTSSATPDVICQSWAETSVARERKEAKKQCAGVELQWNARVQIYKRRCLAKQARKVAGRGWKRPAFRTEAQIQQKARQLCQRKQRLCEIYARKSMVQVAKNQKGRCEQTWPRSRQTYLRSCLKTPAAQTQQVLALRNSILEQCSKLVRSANLVGCFLDRKKPDLDELLGKGYLPGRCLRECKEKGFRFAGLQYGGYCFCGNRYGRYGKRPRLECVTPCEKDKRKTCGGPWRNHIYRTGLRPALRARRYLGCFLDKKKRDLSVVLGKGKTPDSCIKACAKQNYSYASVQNGGWCMCGNSYGRHGRRPLGECDTRCTKNRRYACGGAWRNGVYETGVPLPQNAPNYLGCFADKKQRDLPVLVGWGYSPPFCILACRAKGFVFAGLQYGNWCFCGLQFGRYGKRPDAECNTRCQRNKKFVCGGPWRNSVYRTADPRMLRPAKRTKSRKRSEKKKVVGKNTGK
jgi:hypothetical protein